MAKLQENIPTDINTEGHISSIPLDSICENNLLKNKDSILGGKMKESRVLVIYTGGTIGMRWKPNSDGASIGG